MIILLSWETREPKAALPSSEGQTLPDERKEGDANDYISGLVFVLYVYHCPYQSALSDF